MHRSSVAFMFTKATALFRKGATGTNYRNFSLSEFVFFKYLIFLTGMTVPFQANLNEL